MGSQVIHDFFDELSECDVIDKSVATQFILSLAKELHVSISKKETKDIVQSIFSSLNIKSVSKESFKMIIMKTLPKSERNLFKIFIFY